MIGILCGIDSEARLLTGVTDNLVALSAASPQRARWEARELVRRGAKRLLSFGLCGGLEPGLAAGTLIIGTAVQASDAAWTSDPAWSDQLRQQIPVAHCGPVWGSETIIPMPIAKAQLYARTRCLAADMESQCVAQVAAESEIPFAVLRSVIDTAAMAIPPAALLPLDAAGRPQIGKILLSLLAHPQQLPDLLRLGHNQGKALAALRFAVEQLR